MSRSTDLLGIKTLAAIAGALTMALPGAGQQLANDKLSLTVNVENGSYQLAVPGGAAILNARVGAEVDHRWLRSSDYPRHAAAQSQFHDALGSGRGVTVTCSGLPGRPDLIYTVQVYEQNPYGTVQVRVHNVTGKQISVQAIRSVEAMGASILDLGGPPSADRVLSDSFSEDWPELRIYDLGKVPNGMSRGAGSQLVYNQDTKQSFFAGALTSDRFLTLIHLKAEGGGAQGRIAVYDVDSTGTTEFQKDFDLKNAPAGDLIELSLPLNAGDDIESERVMLEAGADYHSQLLAYGDAIRRLHNARVDAQTPIGWWSWTAYYGNINEGETLANADWQAVHVKSLGYTYLQVDEGYQYARGEYITSDATRFPDGMRIVGHHVTANGLTFGVWTSPFQVTTRAWVYEHHKDWLVHNAKGKPISSGRIWNQPTDTLYSLDTTHPGAQEYLRQTYKTLVREWGVRFIKLDFMDTAAIEGYRYRPNTTALEAQRIGLQIIRSAVGEDVIIDKDGSPMLNPVGLVDTGRISQDTGHSFKRTKDAGSGIAARFYMNRNFFVDDPDAFNTISEQFADRPGIQHPLSLSAAEASIALSAVSGGMYEIGDDMLVLDSQKDRLALVENRDLLNMAKVGRASTPVDLMTYQPEDEQPSIFFLPESPRQFILTIFNWTDIPRSHTFNLDSLGLPAGHNFSARNVLDQDAPIILEGGAVHIENQPPQSVKMVMLTDINVPANPPTVRAQVPSAAIVAEPISLSAQVEPGGVPAIAYHWDFGDGTSADGPKVSHTYTRAAEFNIQLTVDGVEGVPTRQSATIKVTGNLRAFPNLRDNRRFVEPTDR
jgi:alpha-galactosidase